MVRTADLVALPDFPSLSGNALFRQLWFHHIGPSICAMSSRDNGAPTIDRRSFAWSQFNADPARGERGTSACAGLAITVIERFLKNANGFSELFAAQWPSEEFWRPIVVEAVSAWDYRCLARPEDVEGQAPALLAREVFETEIGRGAVRVENLVAVDKSEFERILATVARPPCGVAVTAVKADDTTSMRRTGDTFFIVSSGGGTWLVNPHPGLDDSGMVVARLSAGVLESGPVLAKFIYDDLLPATRCVASQLEITVIAKLRRSVPNCPIDPDWHARCQARGLQEEPWLMASPASRDIARSPGLSGPRGESGFLEEVGSPCARGSLWQRPIAGVR